MSKTDSHKMLLHLAPLICLIAAAAAQQTIYCDSFTGTIRLSDFYLVTLRQSESNYPPGMTCEFNAETNMAAFLIEIESFSVSSAMLKISSGSATLFSSYSSYIESYQKVIVTPSKSLRVRFDARGDYSHSRGIRMRIRAFDSNGCPANWQYMYGYCFGTSTVTGRLNYIDAQRACNSMRSNLLHIPSNYGGSIGAFMRMLPFNLRSYYTWIGLTDRGTQYRHYWLNGARQYSTSEISCTSGGSYLTCFSKERCAAFNQKNNFYAIYMDTCSDNNDYACSMPPGGTNYFYSVPNSGYYTNNNLSSAVIWGIVTGCMVIAGCIISAVYYAVRHNNMRRATANAGGANVVLTASRVTIPPPVGSNPAPPQYPAYYPQPQAFEPPPPDYNAATAAGGAGYGNMGYVK